MKKIILLSMLVMALFVNCTSTEKKAGSSSKELNPQLKGGIFLTSFYTGVKYNDVVVKDKNGAVIFEDNFSVKKDKNILYSTASSTGFAFSTGLPKYKINQGLEGFSRISLSKKDIIIENVLLAQEK